MMIQVIFFTKQLFLSTHVQFKRAVGPLITPESSDAFVKIIL